MSSFFTLPASQKKRKRSQPSEQSGRKGSTPSQRKEARDESISGSDVSEDDAPAARDEEYESTDDEAEFEGEDPAAKRIRLAEQYLANTQQEVLQEDGGFDAAEVDVENLRQRMGERLKEDSAESKGKLYRWIADDFDWSGAGQRLARLDGKSVTGVAVQGRCAYTVGQDMVISKWELPSQEISTRDSKQGDGKQVGRPSTKPKRIKYARGSRARKNDRDYQYHTNSILCIAASQDGRFVATGGADKRLIVWDAATLNPLKVFTQHRDSVTSLAFRRDTNQLFSASRDRTVKIWSLDELAYVETLFGHQDEVVDVSALAEEKCVTVGARDRTARQWKVVEESQLVFRGGGAPGKSKSNRDRDRDSGTELPEQKPYNEGSMDRVACIDDETFITGSDNGSLSLWNIHKKKAVFTYPTAHGLDPPPPAEDLAAEETLDGIVQLEPLPRWITALRAIPFSDVFVTGSWDGYVRVWRISPDKRRIEALGAVGGGGDSLAEAVISQKLDLEASSELLAAQDVPMPRKALVGVINDLAIVDRGERAKDGVLVVAGVGKEHRLGRWKGVKEAKNTLVMFEVPRKALAAAEPEVTGEGENGGVEEDEGFAGFD